MLTRCELLEELDKLVCEFSSAQNLEVGKEKEGDTLSHIRWMLSQAAIMPDVNRCMRWIGFIQGSLWSTGLLSADRLRELNVETFGSPNEREPYRAIHKGGWEEV